MRVLRPGGRLLITEYGEQDHWLYRMPPMRYLLARLEPFLADFRQQNLDYQLHLAAGRSAKYCRKNVLLHLFGGFYRVVEYRVYSDEHDIDRQAGV